MTQESTQEETLVGDTYLPQHQEVTQKHLEAAEAAGLDPETVQAAADAINATPPIEAKDTFLFGLGVDGSQFRVAREYDAQEAQDTGVVDASRFVLYTVMGRVEFVVPRSAVLAALTAEVPYVAPAKAPEQP